MSSKNGFRACLLIALMVVATGVLAHELELHTIQFDSPTVNRTMKYNILLPHDYKNSHERYPVLYLLHGVNGNYTSWGTKSGAPFYAALYDDLIVVMPDAGNISWYVNWAENREGQKNSWDDYIVNDVVNHVDNNFRTIARREGRAICGHSMGGYGSIMLGLRHPEMFISIGSTSGYLIRARSEAESLRKGPSRTPRRRSRQPNREELAVERFRNRPDPTIGIEGFSSYVERTPKGTMFATPEQADAHDPFTLIHQIPVDNLPHIYLDCGIEDPLIAFTHEFAHILIDKGISFDFMQMRGGHDSNYSMRAIGHIMSVQYEVMQRALGQRPVVRRR